MSTIFVFGSNLAGRHGAGSALHAKRHHGAVYGCGVGLAGSSYAIPTKDAKLNTLPLDKIAEYVADFVEFARQSPDLQFEVVDIGCGLAGYKPAEIATVFKNIPPNVSFIGNLQRYIK
jgi:hypothetical protein